ncbi:39817_t:CDS:2 [Gigaspora margarita]|uniref:39817_t:CDS:1 n=1 Tax=Gigaspora margarita TaxID=4874 RepID=A0ABN7UYL7_GIGMA|nr:39817_t:CDS:2 [Gigaspora margarita]
MQLIKPVGCPHLEEAQPGLLETILYLVSFNRQTDERRHSKIIWSVKTLDQLHTALEQINYKISRLATYLRLLPKWFNTEEGKQHVKTVSVKLLRSQNTARKRHKNTHFCASFVRNIKEIVSLLGPQSVLTIFQDDKARISLGLAIANKQAPILMRVEYRVELPDHDWIVAKKHKLIPFVYAILEMQSGKYGNAEAITYSGLTFIRIRSGKHNTSTAYTHSKDFDDLMSDERLHNFTTTEDADGGPDENPCYKKTIQVIIEHFIKYDLDTIIVVCFALHQTPLSHDLAEIILPYDTFGSHLDEQLKTTNDELEKHNFKAAEEILASVPTINKSINEYLCSFCHQYFGLKKSLKHHIQKCPYKLSNSLTNNQGFQDTDHLVYPIVIVHNYQYGEFLVSNDKGEAIWIEEDTIPEDAPELLFQEVKHIRTNQDHQAYLID